MTQQLLRKTACPQCRQRNADTRGDNLAIYEDHAWCYACGYFEVPNNSLSLCRVTDAFLEKQKQNGIISLPFDCSFSIAEIARSWLNSYGITDKEIEEHHILWSKSLERLIFPVFDRHSGSLLFWQGRLFSTTKQGAKQYTQGSTESVFHIVPPDSNDPLCVVEDIISCIKVSRVTPCMPLWGSNLSSQRIVRLARITNNLIIWLDKDKQGYATRRSITARPFFDSVRVISTEYDPKVYATDEITSILGIGNDGTPESV